MRLLELQFVDRTGKHKHILVLNYVSRAVLYGIKKLSKPGEVHPEYKHPNQTKKIADSPTFVFKGQFFNFLFGPTLNLEVRLKVRPCQTKCPAEVSEVS